jgi:hypothetical protein
MMGIDRNPEFLVRKHVQHFGLQSVRHYPWRVQELYADAVSREP